MSRSGMSTSATESSLSHAYLPISTESQFAVDQDALLPPSKHQVYSTTAKRSQNYWFEDGNVIFNVQDTLYRVHRGIISHHSRILTDLLEFPDGTFEGCNAELHLQGDRSADWNVLLSVIYDHDMKYQSLAELDLSLLNSILRLGKKYQIHPFYKAALKRLALVLPTTLDAWTAMSNNHSNPHEFFQRYSPLDLLRTVLEMKLERYLPIALYYCVTELTLENVITLCITFTPNSASTLSMEISRKLFSGFEKIRKAIIADKLSWNNPTITLADRPCTDPVQCARYREHIAMKFCANPSLDLALLFWGDEGTQIFIDMKNLGLDLCADCNCEAGRVFNEGRVVIWENLPFYFSLSGWDDLEDPLVSL